MGLRLVDNAMEGNRDDDRESLAEARRAVAGARGRLEGIADRLAQFGRRLGQGAPEGGGGTFGTTQGSSRGGSLPGDGS